MAEQHAGRCITDVLTLHTDPEEPEPLPSLPPDTGGVAVADAPPRVRRKHVVNTEPAERRRSLAIRHVSGHRLVALLEIVAPGNKDRREHVEELVTRAASALHRGVHLLLVDLFPPGLHDPNGIHGAILERMNPHTEPHEVPAEEPITLVSYAAEGWQTEVYLEHAAVGAPLPAMPLFLRPDRYVSAPLDATFETAWRGMPPFWREVLEQGSE